MQDTFIYIWQLLNPAYEYTTAGRKLACRRLWESFDISRQRYTYRTIRDKLRQGEPVNPNPYFAIEDNSRAPVQKDIRLFVPTNYNGARSLPDEPLVRAIYNGTGGLYSDAKRPLSSGFYPTFSVLLSYFCAHPQPGERNHKRACKILRLYCQGLTEREISDTLKISQPTVHQYLERAVERLKAITKRL